MLTALLADVHSNLEALEACLRHAREVGAERFAFLGDLVGYGPDPSAVVDRAGELVERGDAVAVKGNHDEAVELGAAAARTRDLNEVAEAAVMWTRGALSVPQREWLRDLPLVVKRGDVCFVHASAKEPGRWTYVEDAGAAQASLAAAETAYVFSGHVHEPTLYYTTPVGKTATFRPTPGSAIPAARRRSWLAIAGSVGQPRDGNPAASYALFDDARASLTFFRIPYDHPTTARKIRAAGLPDMLAERLSRGR